MTKSEWIAQYKGKLSARDVVLLERCYDVLYENVLEGDMPWGTDPVISPWIGSSEGIWNWDSVFHSVTVARFDAELAKSCIDSFAKFQRENGILPDVIFMDGRVMDNYTKPPVFAWGVLRVYEQIGDGDFLRRNYDRSVAYEKFWTENRYDGELFYYSAQEAPEKDGYLHPKWESGWDNSPRWDVCPIVELYPVDLNCFMVLYYRALSEMARILGEDAEDWKAKESALIGRIESLLYDAEQGAYADRNRYTGEFSKVLSPASFMPLFAKAASPERAAAMNELARNNRKFYPGMPTVTYDCGGYNNDYWRGPTWLNVAFFAVKGLYDYGYSDTANEIKEFLLDMCYDNLPKVFENYDSKTRLGRCCNSFSWSAAFIIEFILQI